MYAYEFRKILIFHISDRYFNRYRNFANINVLYNRYLCYVGPCHHGMARSRVADGGDGLHIWKVTASTLNKQ
jgi:hypothetical protein